MGCDQQMYMVWHDHIGMQVVVMERLGRIVNRLDDGLAMRGCRRLTRSRLSRVEIAVHPDKSLARVHLPGWWITRMGQAAMQVPGQEQRPTDRMLVRQTPPVLGHGL